MKYCSNCGHNVTSKIPADDNRPRFVCVECKTIHYQNPRLITGTLPVAKDGRILLCKRNIEPRKNYWTLPAGFMENGETTIEGALRETYEESCVQPIQPKLLSIISLPAWDQVHLFYQVNMVDDSFSTTSESNEVKLFQENEIPWDQLAFPTVSLTLKHYFQTLTNGFSILEDDIQWLDQ